MKISPTPKWRFILELKITQMTVFLIMFLEVAMFVTDKKRHDDCDPMASQIQGNQSTNHRKNYNSHNLNDNVHLHH